MRMIDILEGVIDASTAFSKRAREVSSKKMGDVVSDVKNRFIDQKNLEDEVAASIEKIVAAENKKLNMHRLRLVKLTADYQKNTNLIDILIWAYDQTDGQEKEKKQLAKEFFEDHLPLLLKIARETKDDFDQLKTDMSKRDWPTGASWSKYTKLDSIIYACENRIKDLRRLERIVS